MRKAYILSAFRRKPFYKLVPRVRVELTKSTDSKSVRFSSLRTWAIHWRTSPVHLIIHNLVGAVGVEPTSLFKKADLKGRYTTAMPYPNNSYNLASLVGIEPTIFRLTAGCFTAQLQTKIIGGRDGIRTRV